MALCYRTIRLPIRLLVYEALCHCSWDYDEDDWECRRYDQADLIAKFLRKSEEVPDFAGKTGKFVENREQLMSIDVANTDYLLGRKLDDNFRHCIR